MIVAIVCITLLYTILIASLTIGFSKVPIFSSEELNLETKFSIIIPFRNEEKYLPNLLSSFSKIKYPTSYFELIFIDDASTDASVEIINRFFETSDKAIPFSIIENKPISNSPKKDAITLGISKAKHPWILTTDADGEVKPKWLQVYDSFIQKHNPIAIAAPVKGEKANNFLQIFQQLDILSLQATTIGFFGLKQPLLCNGANFAYSKEAFIEVEGFKDNNKIASGDDIFLLEKFAKKYQEKIAYLKSHEATVTTRLEKNCRAIIEQRVRWASKTTKQQSALVKLTGLVVVAINFLLVVLGVTSFFEFCYFYFLASVFLLKLMLDYMLLSKTKEIYTSKISTIHFLVSSIIYPILSLLVFTKSLLGNYQWKNRKFKK
ncbi:glycosyltransferase [Patiriisocius hiemis]|uniref:Glycosyltransferase n=1 Tax=Patiriisocius hiemis TaxID=3075604 RepID=A0ABU2YEZ6_9FLAO|nr:glycosyltransferase [Constantimarinum sp. W242]MDT0556350.1 glycosyltransferase [Constantimarinum sp. W242]